MLLIGAAWQSNPARADADSFEITRFAVEGNTVLPQRLIDATLAPLLGKGRDFSHVQLALEALDNAYREQGYNAVHVSVPEQSLNRGVVRLRVVEIRVGSMRIEGNAVFDEANIRRSLPGLRPGRTPNIHEVAANLKLANDNPAKRTSVQFRESAGTDGRSSLDVLVRTTGSKAWKLNLSLDNAGGGTGTMATGSTRAGIAYQHANVAGLDHVARLQFTTSLEQPGKVSSHAAAYRIPLYQLGDSLDFFAGYSDAGSGPTSIDSFDLNTRGSGTMLAARYNQHLRQVGDLESRLIYGINHRAYRNDAPLPGMPADHRIAVQPLSLGYAGRWLPDSGELAFRFGLAHNLPGGSGAADLDRARAGADARYTLMRYGASLRLNLSAEWRLSLIATGQHTHDRLVWPEQFTLGGARSVRGFREADIAGDKGHALTAELQTSELCAGNLPLGARCRLAAFYDTGRVTRNGALPGEDTRSSIASAGLGLRLNMGPDVSLHIDYARVIDGGGSSANGEQRVHAAMVLTY